MDILSRDTSTNFMPMLSSHVKKDFGMKGLYIRARSSSRVKLLTLNGGHPPDELDLEDLQREVQLRCLYFF